jgi:hypothetical protein
MTAGSRQRGEGLMSGWPDMKQGPEKNKKDGQKKQTKKPRHAVAFMIRTACAFVRRESVTKPAAPLRERRAATSEFGLDAVHARKNTTRKALV